MYYMQCCEPPQEKPNNVGLVRMETRSAANSGHLAADNLSYDQIQARQEKTKPVNRTLFAIQLLITTLFLCDPSWQLSENPYQGAIRSTSSGLQEI